MSQTEILKLKITTDGAGKIKADLLGVSDGVEKVDKKTKEAGKSFLNFKNLLTGVSVAGLVYFSQKALQAADDLSAMASRIGVTASALQEFDYVGMQYNITQATMEMGLQRLFRRFGDAQRGIGEATKMFQDLNVSLYDNNGQLKTNDQIFNDVADSIAGMNDEAAQLSATVKLVDSEAAGMVDVFRAGSDEIVRLRMEAHSMGVVMSDDVVDKAADANLKIETLSKVLKTQFTVALTELTPLLVTFGNKMAAAAKEAGILFEMGNDNTQSADAISRKLEVLNEDMRRLTDLRDSLNQGWGGVGKAFKDAVTMGTLGSADAITQQIEEKKAKWNELYRALADMQGKAWLDAQKEPVSSTKQFIDPALLNKTIQELEEYRAQIGATAQELLTMQVRTKLQVSANDELDASVTTLISAIVREKEEQERLNQLKSEATGITEQMLSPVERYTQQQTKLNDMLAAGYISLITYNRAMEQTGEDLEAAQFGQFFADLSEGTEQLKAATNSWASQFTDQLTELAITGKGNFSDLTDSIIRDLTRIAIQQAILQPLFASFGFTAQPTPVPTGAGHAAGGGTQRGTLYPINEMRPEILSTGGKDYLMMGANDGYVHAAKPSAGARSNNAGATFNVNVVNKNEGTARVENMQPNNSGGFDMDLVIDQLDNALASRQQMGQSAFGNTLSTTTGGNRAVGGY